MNDNASGSLRNIDCNGDEDDDYDDDDMYEPKTTIYQPNENDTNSEIATPVSTISDVSILGVAALPNTEFTVAGSSDDNINRNHQQRTKNSNNDLDV